LSPNFAAKMWQASPSKSTACEYSPHAKLFLPTPSFSSATLQMMQ